MGTFAVLTNRKRAIIALVHSVFFLMLACITSLRTVAPLSLSSQHRAVAVMPAIYLIVTAVLGCLVLFSGCLRERLYFALCTTSAGTALLRAIVGDRAMHGAQYLRVVALTVAVLLCAAIVRSYAPAALFASE